jgi:hypothetical protein
MAAKVNSLLNVSTHRSRRGKAQDVSEVLRIASAVRGN